MEISVISLCDALPVGAHCPAVLPTPWVPSFRFASKFQYGISMLFCCIFEELGVVNYGSL